MTKIKKYRPSLTEQQLRYIVSLAKKEVPLTELSYSVIQVLDTYLYKLGNNSIVPSSSYVLKPVANSLDSLGAHSSTPGSTPGANTLDPEAYPDKVAYWEACYTKYITSGADSCNLTEITNAQEHRYLEGLMSEEEIAAFELQQFQDYNQ